jgi:hypothetical protein
MIWYDVHAAHRQHCGGAHHSAGHASKKSWNGPSSRRLHCTSRFNDHIPFEWSPARCEIRIPVPTLGAGAEFMNGWSWCACRWVWHFGRAGWSDHLEPTRYSSEAGMNQLTLPPRRLILLKTLYTRRIIKVSYSFLQHIWHLSCPFLDRRWDFWTWMGSMTLCLRFLTSSWKRSFLILLHAASLCPPPRQVSSLISWRYKLSSSLLAHSWLKCLLI